MDIDQHLQTMDILGLLLGHAVPIAPGTVDELLQRNPVRSSTRRGTIVAVGTQLVRISETEFGYMLERLHYPAGLALEPWHEHIVTCLPAPDGWDVVCCVTCGMEW